MTKAPLGKNDRFGMPLVCLRKRSISPTIGFYIVTAEITLANRPQNVLGKQHFISFQFGHCASSLFAAVFTSSLTTRI
jgi:hypothetical protein